MFIAGIGLFLLIIYLLSALIWDVQVEGNEQIDKQTILEAAEKHGLSPLKWKFKLEDPEVISHKLMLELPNVSWVGVTIEGTKVRVEVVESDTPDEQPARHPRHIVAAHDAVVTRILAEKGVPKAKKNMTVKKGDVLISGLLGDEERQAIVPAEGAVFGLVWHEVSIEMPLERKWKVYTGEQKKRSYFIFAGRALKVKGYGKLEYESYESERDSKQLSWRDWVLPIGWMKETVRESELVSEKLSLEEAKQIALEQARAEVLLNAGKDAQIKKQNILHERSENGKVYMKVIFEVDQNIAEEKVIIDFIQGE